MCTKLLVLASLVLVMVTLPFSLCLVIKVVQEYERTVIFRLGRILSGGVEKIFQKIFQKNILNRCPWARSLLHHPLCGCIRGH